MRSRALLLVIMLSVLSSCQSVPAERKNHCSCLWEPTVGLSGGVFS
jgi:hypothetical protein